MTANTSKMASTSSPIQAKSMVCPSKRKAWCQASKHPCQMIADATAALMGHGVPEAAVVPLQRLETAEQSIVWITASEDGASATCVGVAPACKELRSGPNKSEREHTSARSTKRERTPNPSFPWHWAHLFIAAVS